MSMIFDYVMLILVASLVVAVSYLYLFAIVGALRTKRYPELSQQYDFLILIPAHNEEQVLATTLESLKHLSPIGKVEIAVIADNCTDRTAEIARSFGVRTLERSDTSAVGKGHTLRWGISQFDLDLHDAVAFVDADTTVEPNMVKSMAESFAAGYGAVQLSYLFTVSQTTHLAHLQHLASLSENLMFYRGRSVLNLPILLRGSGMAIRADVLKTYPWDSYSLTEDVDYAVNLLAHGVRIDFNSNSTVYSAATSTYEQSVTQKTRWASGTIQLVRDKLFKLVGRGLRTGSPKLVELGFSLLLLSRPFLIYSVFAVLLINLIFSPPHQTLYSLVCLLLIGFLIMYILLGIFYVRDKAAAFKSLCMIPFYGLWFLFVQILAIVKSGKLHWHRTERKT